MNKDVKSVSFTLLELILSIGSIIIIALMIIPFIANIFNVTEKKIFVEFADLVNKETLKKYNNLVVDKETCYVFDITKDLELDELGSFEGYSIVKDNHVYLSIHNKDYKVSNMEYYDKEYTNEFIVNYDNNNYIIEEILSNIDCQTSEYMTK